MKLKVCGMKYNPIDVAQLGPDYLGFIFWEPSARYFDQPMPSFPKGLEKVGVFVDAPIEVIVLHIYEYELELIQLHGSEDPAYCLQLWDILKGSNQSLAATKIIKAFAIDEQFNFNVLQAYEKVCDYYLFDTKGKLPGGTGKKFDWNILKEYNSTKPFFLSGGIGLSEVDSLENFLKTPQAKLCQAIDVNSKFEMEPGLKNIEDLKILKEELKRIAIKN